MQHPATFVLFRDLGATRPDHLPAIALCAGVLAAARENRPEHPARTVGAPSLEHVELATMKPLRFQRLIAARSPAERLTLLRRTIAIAGAALNVRELAAACLDWSEDRQRRWIFEYYAAGRAVPASNVETVSIEEIGA